MVVDKNMTSFQRQKICYHMFVRAKFCISGIIYTDSYENQVSQTNVYVWRIEKSRLRKCAKNWLKQRNCYLIYENIGQFLCLSD
jgi:hypothetical protein